MLKKIIIAVAILAVLGIVAVFVIPWGEYESTLDKTELTSEVEDGESWKTNPTLDNLQGIYQIDSSQKSRAEILFLTDGLKDTKGGFDGFTIELNVPEDYTQGGIFVWIDTKSINSGNAMRDEHLLEEDFFNAAAYPEITYVSNNIELGDTSYVAIGELTLNGLTKELNLPFKHLGSGDKDGVPFEAFEGLVMFDRTQYGQEESSGAGNEVTISFYCELEQQ